jgi:hypothetical protein
MEYFGKEYKEVKDRIAEFRSMTPEKIKGNGYAIGTEILWHNEDFTRVAIKAYILDPEKRVLSTGIAFESQTSSNTKDVNFSAWVENCETSAIGRAFANIGIATPADKQRPSAEEMGKVTRAQEAAPDAKQASPAKPLKLMNFKSGPVPSSNREKLVKNIMEMATMHKSVIGHDMLFSQIMENHKFNPADEAWVKDATLNSLEAIAGTMEGISNYIKVHEITKLSEMADVDRETHHRNLKKLTLF